MLRDHDQPMPSLSVDGDVVDAPSGSTLSKPESGTVSRRTLLKSAAVGGSIAVVGGSLAALAGASLVSQSSSTHAANSAALQVSARGKLREYWIQADSFFNNLVPSGLDGMTGQHYTKDQTSYWAVGFRAYTPGWEKPLPGNNDIGPNTGIPGPNLRAEVGDTVRVHFRNNDTHYGFPHSMHPHGFFYTPDNDGAWIYIDIRPGTAIEVGHSYTYEWIAHHDSVGTWVYHDHTKPLGPQQLMEFGEELGLFGLIAITDASTPPVDQEIFLFFHELLQADIPALSMDYFAFNGRAFAGNTPTFTARVGDRVRWRIGALGSMFHVFHLHGHRWVSGDRFADSLILGPSTTVTFDYVEDNPGTWLYHCHVRDHMMMGMTGLYKATQ